MKTTMSALVMLALVVGGCGESGEEQDTLNRGNEAVGQDQGGRGHGRARRSAGPGGGAGRGHG
jgi:hypothetical protein